MTALAFVLAFFGGSENINWFQKAAHEIKSIDPNHIDFTDLEPLKRAIGNRRIIMLGEQDHGDGSAIDAKIRLIKFLHEEMGFNVLAFEGGFYECNRVGDLFYQKKLSIEDIKNAIYICWRKTSNFVPLLTYLEKENTSTTPLYFAGFDCRHKGPYSEAHFLKEFDQMVSLLPTSRLNQEKFQDFRCILGELFDLEYRHNPTEKERSLFLDVLQSIQNLLSQGQVENLPFWEMELSNLRGFANNAWCNGMEDYRDQQMGENLLWLKQTKFPEQKIIVWAHNFHILKNKIQTFDIETHEPNPPSLSMGTVVNRKCGDDVYFLGFVAYKGRHNYLAWKGVFDQVKDIPVPSEMHLESLLNDLNVPFAYVDFLGVPTFSWIRKKHWMKGVQPYSDANEDWTSFYDGIFFIQTMEPSKAEKE